MAGLIGRTIMGALGTAALFAAPVRAQSADAALAAAKALDAQATSRTTTPAAATPLRAKAYLAFADACDRGSREGCAAAADPMRAFLALVLVTSEAEQKAWVAKYEGKYQAMVRTSCLSGVVDDCTTYYREHKADAAVAAALSTACGKEDRSACYALGRLTATDQSATDKATSDAQAGCTKGDAALCYRLGAYLASEGPGGRDPAKGRELLGRACDLGYEKGCLALAQVLIGGMGGAADHLKARQLLLPACERGTVDACRMVVRSAIDPKGPAPDAVLAWRIATRLCAAKQLDGCMATTRIDLPGEHADDAAIRKIKTMRDADLLLTADCERRNTASCTMKAEVAKQIDQLRDGCAQQRSAPICQKGRAAGLL